MKNSGMISARKSKPPASRRTSAIGFDEIHRETFLPATSNIRPNRTAQGMVFDGVGCLGGAIAAEQQRPAQRRFHQALELNQSNWVARVNLYCNTNLQSGTNMSLAAVGKLAAQMGRAQNLMLLMSRIWDRLTNRIIVSFLAMLINRPDSASGHAAIERAQALVPDVAAPELGAGRNICPLPAQ